MRTRRLFIPVAIVAIWIAALVGLYHIISQHRATPSANPTALIAYTAALVALAGWMFQSWLSVRNSRKQHTMNVLLQTRLNPLFSEHAKAIEAAFPSTTPITFTALTLPANSSVRSSVQWVLNYYEFIAAGIAHGDLDEALMQDCILTQFCSFFTKSEDYIRNARREDKHGVPEASRARVMKSVLALQPRWQRKLENELAAWERQAAGP
jgi:Domain of unknown function (DUF4760)